jgi:hypothetical protein
MATEYVFMRDGVPERVQPEKWRWGVIYQDDTELLQFGVDGIFHQFREIEQDKVKMFVMYTMGDANSGNRIDTVIDPETTQIFHFYRNMMLDQGSENARTIRVYVFGTKNKVTGAMHYTYILPDDRLIQADHDVPHLTDYQI